MNNNLPRDAFYRTVKFLRKQFVWSATYKAVRKAANRDKNIDYCAGCNELINTLEQKTAVDHIDPVGSFHGNKSLDYAASRIWCDPANLQVLCTMCHAFKTLVDREEIKEKKSLLEKMESGEL